MPLACWRARLRDRGLPWCLFTPGDHETKEKFVGRDAEKSTPEACATLLQLAEPTQRNGSLCVVDFVAAVERAYPYPLKSVAFD